MVFQSRLASRWHSFCCPNNLKWYTTISICSEQRRTIGIYGRMGTANCFQKCAFGTYYGSRLVPKWRVSRYIRDGRQSPYLADKRSNHRHHVPPFHFFFIGSYVKRHPVFNVVALAWHPTTNTLSFTTSQGQLYRWKECLPPDLPPSYGSVKKAPANNYRPEHINDSSSLSRSPSILSRGRDPFDDDLEDEDDDFVIDDDGAGYVPSHARKRNVDWGDDEYPSKRGRGELASVFRVKMHEPFQSGSTPWRGNRRYLSKYSIHGILVI